MKKLILALLAITLAATASAQSPLGYYRDAGGTPIEGHSDPVLAQSFEGISHSYVINARGYERGYYYSKEGEKVEGLIRFNNRKAFFSSGELDIRGERLDPEECSALVVGTDSFFIAKADVLGFRSPQFMKYVTSFDGMTFGRFYYSPALSQENRTAYHVKKGGDPKWHALRGNSLSGTYKAKVTRFFSDYDSLCQKVKDGVYEESDALELIKKAEIQYRHQKGMPVRFDRYWNETQDASRAKYHAEVIHKTDSSWVLAYYEGEYQLYEVSYSSLYPHEKEGKTIAYDTAGHIRVETLYQEGKPHWRKVYYPNSDQLHYKYSIRENKGEFGNTYTWRHYHEVYSASGEALLDDSGSGQETWVDPISGRKITVEYLASRAKVGYTEIEGKRYYHTLGKDYTLRKGKIQYALSDYFSSKPTYYGAIEDNAEGEVYIAVYVDEKGRIESSRVLNKIHEELHALIETFAYKYLNAEGDRTLRLKKFRVEGDKVPYEFVLRVSLGKPGFYKEPTFYLFDHHHNHWQWQWQQQQIHNSVINNIQVPSFPR